MSDPLVRIQDEAGHEWQVFKSNFHRLYEGLGYKITYLIGDSEGPNEVAPPAPESTTEHVAPPPAVADAPAGEPAPVAAADGSAEVNGPHLAPAPAESAPAETAPSEPAPATDAAVPA